ncbi:CG0192-related protein [Micromonospora yangpuensis]|uniref:Maltokinase N-terminal cap domain-containing protein n=1 Tax=Micromonospora yangpuensis TaxID=683228 RepID=A0A1C6UI77_9ACTN|nr:hypothetical protein [Micromonospora yangpuensis]SCL53553.1 hypothetical protein GA0070617_2399 [Micromonospora yangpuensis]
MALLHRAELRPTKFELLAAWMPGREWFHGRVGRTVDRVAAYRFDDPAGQVGIETLLVRTGEGPVHQVPLTYRDAPIEGADGHLIGVADHTVLGRRWVYDAIGDPVYAAALASAVLAGTGQASEYFESDGGREYRAPSMTVAVVGAGPAAVPQVGAVLRVVDADPAVVVTDAVELTVCRRLGADRSLPADAPVLTGTWDGQPTALALAYASPR